MLPGETIVRVYRGAKSPSLPQHKKLGNVRPGSFTSIVAYPRNVCLSLDSDRKSNITDPSRCPRRAEHSLPSRLDAICTANGDGIATSMSISRTVFSILVCRATAGQLADNGASVLCCGSEGDFGPLYTQTMVSRGNMRHVEGTGRSLRTLPLNRRRVDWESSFSRERCRYEWACSA